MRCKRLHRNAWERLAGVMGMCPARALLELRHFFVFFFLCLALTALSADGAGRGQDLGKSVKHTAAPTAAELRPCRV